MLIYLTNNPAPYYRVFATEFPGKRVSILNPVDYIISKLGEFFPGLEHPSVYREQDLRDVFVFPGTSLISVIDFIRSTVPITAYLDYGRYDVLIITETTECERDQLRSMGAFIFGEDVEQSQEFADLLILAGDHMAEYEKRKEEGSDMLTD